MQVRRVAATVHAPDDPNQGSESSETDLCLEHLRGHNPHASEIYPHHCENQPTYDPKDSNQGSDTSQGSKQRCVPGDAIQISTVTLFPGKTKRLIANCIYHMD